MPSRPALSHHLVTAVLVVHDGESWLPRTLAALRDLQRAPQRLVAVDTGSRDRSVDLLVAEFGHTRVLRAPRTTGFGAAVRAGVEAYRGTPLPPGATTGQREPVEWIWLLHDDCAPAPDALERMLALAEGQPSAVVIGPKLHDWYEPRVLLEVGLTTDRMGHRHSGVDHREVDQGQHDDVTDVLAVGSAGALVRRDVWEALGGYDERLPLFRDDLDFGWRASRAGHRVVVATDAVVLHAQAGARGLRALDATTDRPHRVDRRHGLYAVLANASALGAAAGLPLLALDALLRAAMFLLTRRPAAAADELAAYGGLLRRLPALLAARRARRRIATPAVPRRALRPLFPRPGARVRAFVDHMGRRVVAPVYQAAHQPARPDARAADGLARRAWWGLFLQPGVLLFVALAVVAGVAERRLLGGGVLVGGRLLPPTGGASDLWSTYLSSWHDVGLGATASAPPYLALLALVATVLVGKVWLAVDVLLLGAVPLAGLTAYAALRRLRARSLLRSWAAATYALLPVATGAVGGGRLGVAVAFVLLPLGFSAGARALVEARRGAGLRRAWVAGLPLAAAVAFAPELYPVILAVLAGALAVAATGRLGLRGGLRTAAAALVLAVVPVALLVPWTLAVWRDPAPLITGVGDLVVAPGRAAPRPLDLLLAHPGGPGMPPVWLLAVVAAAGLAATLRRDRPASVAVWSLVGAGVLVGLVDAHTRVTPPLGGPELPGWPGAATAVVGAGLVLATVLAAHRVGERLSRRSFGWRQLTAGLLAAATVCVPVGLAVAWVVRGTPGPVRLAAARSVLPVFVAEDLAGSPGVRVLVLHARPDGTVGYSLAGGSQRTLATADLAPEPVGAARLDAAVRSLTGAPGSAAGGLATMGVRYVVAAGFGDGRVDAALDNQPGLVRSTAAGPVGVWRVLPPAGRLELLPPGTAVAALSGAVADPAALLKTPAAVLSGAGGRMVATLPAGPADRLLVVATPADRHWQATLDGRPLARRTAWGWAQGFVVPATGGRLVVRHAGGWRSTGLWFELGFLLLSLVLAAPAVRADSGPPPVEPAPADDHVIAGPRRSDPEEAAGPAAEPAGSARSGR